MLPGTSEENWLYTGDIERGANYPPDEPGDKPRRETLGVCSGEMCRGANEAGRTRACTCDHRGAEQQLRVPAHNCMKTGSGGWRRWGAAHGGEVDERPITIPADDIPAGSCDNQPPDSGDRSRQETEKRDVGYASVIRPRPDALSKKMFGPEHARGRTLSCNTSREQSTASHGYRASTTTRRVWTRLSIVARTTYVPLGQPSVLIDARRVPAVASSAQ